MKTPTQIVEEFLDDLDAQEFIPMEDIAWVAVTQEFLEGMDLDILVCPIRQCNYKNYRGVEFRVNEWASKNNDLTGRFAWNITKRTKDKFNYEKQKGKN